MNPSSRPKLEGMGSSMGRRLPVLVVVGFAIACSSVSSSQLEGRISQLSPTLCVAAPRATGECFDARPSDVANYRVGDCVVVVYQSRPADRPATLTSIQPSASDSSCRTSQYSPPTPG